MSKNITIKWNNGNLAILCDKCRTIIKTGKDFTEEEHEVLIGLTDTKLPAQYCTKCK